MPGGPKGSQREKVLASLMDSQNLEEAAQKAGVSRRTVVRWLGEPAFKEEYLACRRQVLAGTVGDLVAAGKAATRTLLEGLYAEKESDRIKAASALLAHAHKGVDAELLGLAEQVEELRQELYRSRGWGGPNHARGPSTFASGPEVEGNGHRQPGPAEGPGEGA